MLYSIQPINQEVIKKKGRHEEVEAIFDSTMMKVHDSVRKRVDKNRSMGEPKEKKTP